MDQYVKSMLIIIGIIKLFTCYAVHYQKDCMMDYLAEDSHNSPCCISANIANVTIR